MNMKKNQKQILQYMIGFIDSTFSHGTVYRKKNKSYIEGFEAAKIDHSFGVNVNRKSDKYLYLVNKFFTA